MGQQKKLMKTGTVKLIYLDEENKTRFKVYYLKNYGK